jgi:hypothetical protein
MVLADLRGEGPAKIQWACGAWAQKRLCRPVGCRLGGPEGWDPGGDCACLWIAGLGGLRSMGQKSCDPMTCGGVSLWVYWARLGMQCRLFC